MEFKILKAQEIQVLTDLFNGEDVPQLPIYANSYPTNIKKLRVLKRQKISKSVLASLDFIEILIDYFVPNYDSKFINNDRRSHIRYSDTIHTFIITNYELYDEFTKYKGVVTEKHTKQYFNEILFLINSSNHSMSLKDKYNDISSKN